MLRCIKQFFISEYPTLSPPDLDSAFSRSLQQCCRKMSSGKSDPNKFGKTPTLHNHWVPAEALQSEPSIQTKAGEHNFSLSSKHSSAPHPAASLKPTSYPRPCVPCLLCCYYNKITLKCLKEMIPNLN